jgi:acyl-CoA hydrolase
MPAISVEDSLVAIEYIVRQPDLNGYMLLHGGRLLTLADEAGFLAAYRFCGRDCLTVAVHRARFHRPARLNDAISLKSQVALTGKSSLWAYVSVTDSKNESLMDAVIVYAAVDDQYRPVRISSIEATSDAGKTLQQQMQQLRASVQGDAG